MIGWVETTRDIPAGSVVYYDADKNALVVFDSETQKLHLVAMPFVVEGLKPDPRVKLP